MLKDYFSFAWNNLVHKKLRSWLTLLGIFIGVMAVVSLISLGDGLKLAVGSQFGISSTEVISVQAGGLSLAGPPGTNVVNPLMQGDVEAIEKLPEVEYAIPRILEQGKIEFNDRVSFGMALSIPDGELRKFAYDVLELEVAEGRLLKDGDGKKVFLGYNFGVDKVGLGKAIKSGDTVFINDERFTVVGIGEKKGSFIFDNIVSMNEDVLKEVFDTGDTVDIIAVKVKNKDLMDEGKESIEKLMRKRRNVKVGEEDFSVETPESALETVNSILTGIQAFISMVAAISIIVGIIGIVNTMTTSVLERRNQIGIMKAIGAKNSDVFFQFFIESGLMGFIGGLAGVIVGVIIGYFGTLGISSFLGAEISPSIDYILIFGTLIGSFVVGAVAGIVPAMQAARQNPVEALRG